MQLRDLDQLPPVLESVQVAEMLGVSVDHLWAMAREGTAPVTPLRLGRVLRWPTAPLLKVLGCEPGRDSGAPKDPATITDLSAATANQVRSDGSG